MALNLNKKVLIHTGAGVAAVLLLLFGVYQCSEKQDEREVNNQNIEQLKDANTQLSNAADALKEANSKISDLSYANDVQADSIIVLNDSIGVLNDSIVVLNDSLATRLAVMRSVCSVRTVSTTPKRMLRTSKESP